MSQQLLTPGVCLDSQPETAPPAGCAVEVSIVMPCLDEADTVETCIRKAQDALKTRGIAGEIIVADNGSTDRSRAIAERAGGSSLGRT